MRQYIRDDNEGVWYTNLQTDGERLFAVANMPDPTSWDDLAISYDEITFRTDDNFLSRKVFGK